jgi:hypothetical protein
MLQVGGGYHRPKPSVLAMFVASAVLLTALSLACVPEPGIAEPEDDAAPTAIVESTMPLAASPQPPIAVYACLDASSSYPASVLADARSDLADLIRLVVQPGFPGVKVEASWITHNSRAAEARLFEDPLSVPPVALRPEQPVLPPQPDKPEALGPEGEFDRKLREAAKRAYEYSVAAWKVEVAKLREAYEHAMRRFEEALRKAQAAATAVADAVVSAPMTQAGGSDIGGCVQAASHALRRSQGEKYILIASDLVPFGEQDISSVDLKDVRVRAFALYCPRARQCDEMAGQWQAFFRDAGARDVDFYVQGEDISTLFD